METSTQIRRDPHLIEVITEVRYRPRHDGVWGEVRKALEEDAAELAEIKAEEKRLHAPPMPRIVRFKTGSGMVMDDPEPGTMSLSAEGKVHVWTGERWTEVTNPLP